MIKITRRHWEAIAFLLLIGGILVVAIPLVIGSKFFIPIERDENVRTVVLKGRISELGNWEPKEVVVKQGERVRLYIYSEDLTHSFSIPEYGINMTIGAGEWGEVEFIADKPGELFFRCTVYCSPGHPFMWGKLIVKPSG